MTNQNMRHLDSGVRAVAAQPRRPADFPLAQLGSKQDHIGFERVSHTHSNWGSCSCNCIWGSRGRVGFLLIIGSGSRAGNGGQSRRHSQMARQGMRDQTENFK